MQREPMAPMMRPTIEAPMRSTWMSRRSRRLASTLCWILPSANALSMPSPGYAGAGAPRPELSPAELPPLLMRALALNDYPEADDGLRAMWAFSSDTTRFIYQNNMTEFIEDAHTTADTLPTSFYGCAFYGEFEMEGEVNMVGGGGDSSWIATQIMKTVSSDQRLRRWQWELRKHRRPPNLNSWYVESVGCSDRLGNFQIEG